MIRLTLLSTLLLAATQAVAGSPAAIPDSGNRFVQASFQEFARQWMRKVRTLEQKHRSHLTVQPGATDPVFTYRGYGEDYSIELQPTGYARAPYVGLLRYTEHLYTCTSMKAENCRIASTVPVTEIFRYRNGRWSY